MKKKNKFSLNDLRVKSFITDVHRNETEQLLGGAQTIKEINCLSLIDPNACGVFTFNSGCHTCGIACTSVDPC